MIKAKPTYYKNILFKSALEASYAKLFDKYNIKWKYEAGRCNFREMGYGTGKHVLYYTPDFLLNDKYWFEVKYKLNLGVRSKEMFFMIDNKLFFGLSFYPLSEPLEIYYYEKVYLKNDGYSNYCADTGPRSMKFNEFLRYIKNINSINFNKFQ
jgi:hypothetical protein